MISKFLSHKNKFFLLLVFLFSLIVNQHYGNQGVFPMDSFHFFDSGYRVLNGETPFMDYWLVKGPLLDYIQAFFFYIFGVNWQSYLLHASIMNALLSISTFFVLKNFKLDSSYCLLYSLFFSLLAYPSSATPFIDHHSAFFSLLGIYSIILAINNKRVVYWIIAPICFGLAFLSKQVPVAYIVISLGIILILYFSLNKRFFLIKYLILGSLFFIFFSLIFGISQGIALSSFLEQYIYYPQTIGKQRFFDLNLTFENFIGNFILIYIAILPMIFQNLKKIFTVKNYIYNNNFYIFLILLFFSLSLIFHQLLTKNQNFIFFLIPILSAFSQISLSESEFKFKKISYIIILLICVFATSKYHLRFNEDRKFHELENVNFDLSIDARQIDNRLAGLKWITPQFKNNPEVEIKLINQIKSILSEDTRKKMLITNYPFFSSILDQNLYSPSRVYTGDGTTHPLKNNEYFSSYQKLMDKLILNNDILVIYVINSNNENINFHYIDVYQHCLKENSLLTELKSYELENCK